MKLAAIICEYNPFHNGHQFHIEETRQKTDAEGIVAIMSGNLMQRGDVAIFDKALRAKAAVLGGANLVIELPASYSSASAEFFALNAIKILNALGNVDYLSFGAENADAASLAKIGELLAKEPAELSDKIKQLLSTGLSFPVARSCAVGEFLGAEYADILSTPNNILGIEYCKALARTNSSITPFPILRCGAAHDSQTTSEKFASATYIRSLLQSGEADKAKQFVPDFATELFKNAKIHSLKALEKAIIAYLIKVPLEELKNAPDVSEGLENRIKEAALVASTLEELIDNVKTKRYTHSRIRRILLSAYFGISRQMRESEPQYISILAHNETGQKIIAQAKKTATLPIVRNTSQVNKLKNPLVKSLWEQERVFDNIYNLTEI